MKGRFRSVSAMIGMMLVFVLVFTMVAGCESPPTEYEATENQERQINNREIRKFEIYSKHEEKIEQSKKLMPKHEQSEGEIKDKTDQQKNLAVDNDNEKVRLNPRKRVEVAGIYVSGWVAGSKRKMNQILKLLKDTELNSVVIDIKNDFGHVTYDSNVPLVNQIGSDRKTYIEDFPALVRKLKKNNIYIIGRLVTFKDPFLAGSLKDTSMKRKDNGKMWRDRRGTVWVDPYIEEVRKYNIDIAKEAINLGVDEIQFDYVRFPDNGKVVDATVRFQNPKGQSKAELIEQFLSDAAKDIHAAGALVSADVFGLTTTLKGDMGIGQEWMKIADEVDYLSPMVYPSHYSSGMYGYRNPDLNPYGVIKQAVKDGLRKNKSISNPAIMRPWYQAFTATWIKPHRAYGKKEIQQQIQAAREQGVKQYLLWNPHCKYDFVR